MPDAGLVEAFVTLRPALLRYLSLQGATVDEAEDLLQEMGVKLTSDTARQVDQPRAYLYRMAHNHFLLHRRSASRRVRREETWVDVHTGDPPEIDEAPSAEARLLAREQLAILQKTIDAMPERTRTIFQRFRIDGTSRREIAVEIGISVSAVEKHLARAYAAITAAVKISDELDPASRSLRQEEGHHGS